MGRRDPARANVDLAGGFPNPVNAETLSSVFPYDDWKSEDSNPPDLIIAGSNVIAHPLLYEDSGAWDAIPIMTPGRTELADRDEPGVSFGLGLACLLYALDWIELRKMPWDQIMMDSIDE